jgi:hypothetical protein
MTESIDLNYRPKSYFGPRRIESCLISQVKGAVFRHELEKLFAEGRYQEIKSILGAEEVSSSDVKAMSAVHPMFMGVLDLGAVFRPLLDLVEVAVVRDQRFVRLFVGPFAHDTVAA